MLEDKGHRFSNVQTDNGLMDAERSMAVAEAGSVEVGRDGNRQVAVVCLGFLSRHSGAVGQIAALDMAVKPRRNVPEGNAELRNAPHLPGTAYTSRKPKRMCSGNNMTLG